MADGGAGSALALARVERVLSDPTALAFALLFCALVFILNSFSVLVTYMMSSVWHAILDNFRPITIWVKAAATAPPPAAALRGRV